MSIFTRITEAFGKGEIRPKNVSYSEAVMSAFGVGDGVTVSADSAVRVSAVAACVAKISGAIMSMPLKVYTMKGAIPEELPRDALWYLLNEECSANYTSASMWEGVSMSQLLRGDAYALIRRAMNGGIKEILPLPWGSVSPVVLPNGGGVRYYVNLPSHGISTWFDPSDILHFPGLGFTDTTMRSMSVIQYGAREAIRNASAMDQYSGKFFENGAHPSMILEAAGTMSAEQITLLQTAFTAKYAGVQNAHRIPLVLTEGLTAKEISISADDAQLLDSRKYQVMDIARAFGVPGFMINESTGATSWGSGIESIGRAFVQYTVNPWLRKIEQELNRKVFPRSGGKFVEYDRTALTAGDTKSQDESSRAALGGPGSGDGYKTVNEIRRERRLPPIAGGDELFKSVPPTAPAPAPTDTPKE